MHVLQALGEMLIFPGALYGLIISMLLAWLDRKLVAVMQGRVGPPIYQPLADTIKLFAKEDLDTEGVNPTLAGLLPVVALACTMTAALLVPVGNHAVISFQGDLVIALFLLSLPTLALFMAGWIVPSVYNVVGGNRTLLQYFAYEVPLLLGLAAPAAFSQSWRITDLMARQAGYRWFVLGMPLGFLVSSMGLIGKLERVPLDAPHAKAEVGAGPLTEYSGRKLAFWRLTSWLQTVVGINLMIAVYLGGADRMWRYWGLGTYLLKMLAYLGGLALVQVLYARYRVDQVSRISWRVLVPLGLLQLLVTVWLGA